MKVLLVNGGPHPKGCTNRALEEVEKALKDIEKQGLRLVPLCPFVAGYIHKHPEWKRIVMKGIHIQ